MFNLRNYILDIFSILLFVCRDAILATDPVRSSAGSPYLDNNCGSHLVHLVSVLQIMLQVLVSW